MQVFNLNSCKTPLQWNETFIFDYQASQPLHLEVIDHDDNYFNFFDFQGQTTITVNQLELSKPVQSWYRLRRAEDWGDPNDLKIEEVDTAALGKIEVKVEWVDGVEYQETQLDVEIVQARGLQAMDIGGSSDPYAAIKLGRQERRTPYQRATLRYSAHFAHEAS